MVIRENPIEILGVSLFMVLILALAAVVTGSSSFAVTDSSTVALALQEQGAQPSKDVKVDIDINRGGGQWYANPVWIAIGVIGLVVLIPLIVMAARGGGSTVVSK